MIVKTLTYGRTKNLGNYQSERLDITVELDETDDPKGALTEAKQFVLAALYPEEQVASSDQKPF